MSKETYMPDTQIETLRPPQPTIENGKSFDAQVVIDAKEDIQRPSTLKAEYDNYPLLGEEKFMSEEEIIRDTFARGLSRTIRLHAREKNITDHSLIKDEHKARLAFYTLANKERKTASFNKELKDFTGSYFKSLSPEELSRLHSLDQASILEDMRKYIGNDTKYIETIAADAIKYSKNKLLDEAKHRIAEAHAGKKLENEEIAKEYQEVLSEQTSVGQKKKNVWTLLEGLPSDKHEDPEPKPSIHQEPLAMSAKGRKPGVSAARAAAVVLSLAGIAATPGSTPINIHSQSETPQNSATQQLNAEDVKTLKNSLTLQPYVKEDQPSEHAGKTPSMEITDDMPPADSQVNPPSPAAPVDVFQRNISDEDEIRAIRNNLQKAQHSNVLPEKSETKRPNESFIKLFNALESGQTPGEITSNMPNWPPKPTVPGQKQVEAWENRQEQFITGQFAQTEGKFNTITYFFLGDNKDADKQIAEGNMKKINKMYINVHAGYEEVLKNILYREQLGAQLQLMLEGGKPESEWSKYGRIPTDRVPEVQIRRIMNHFVNSENPMVMNIPLPDGQIIKAKLLDGDYISKYDEIIMQSKGEMRYDRARKKPGDLVMDFCARNSPDAYTSIEAILTDAESNAFPMEIPNNVKEAMKKLLSDKTGEEFLQNNDLKGFKNILAENTKTFDTWLYNTYGKTPLKNTTGRMRDWISWQMPDWEHNPEYANYTVYDVWQKVLKGENNSWGAHLLYFKFNN